MSSSVRVPGFSSRPFSESLSRVPQSARKQFREGYSVICRVSPNQRELILQRAMMVLEEAGSPFAGTALLEQTGLSGTDASAALGSMMFLISGLVTETSARKSEDVVEEMLKANLVESSDKTALAEFVASLGNRLGEFQLRLERVRLAAHILPAFRALITAVDVRFETGEKRLAVPIGLLRFLTDEEDAGLHFQVTSSQLVKLMSTLRELHEQMQALDKVAQIWEKGRE